MILSYSRKRRGLYFLLYASGISSLALRLGLRRRPLVLLAHRVLEGRNPTESLLIDAGAALSVTDFERRIRFLVGHLRAAAMADYLGGTAGHNSFVLTFDDGYRDNLALALPILRHYRVPMHIFVTTGFVNGQSVPWVDRVARVCSMAANGSCRVAGLDFELPLKRPAGRCIAFDQICRTLRTWEAARIEKTVADLEHMLDVVPYRVCDDLFLSLSELAAAEELVSFGSHSASHANFQLLDLQDVEAEAEGSRQWLETATGSKVCTFAYPYGFAGDYSNDYFRRALASPLANWRHVFGTGGGRAGDRLEDQRLNLNLQPFFVFHVEVSGAWALARQAWRR